MKFFYSKSGPFIDLFHAILLVLAVAIDASASTPGRYVGHPVFSADPSDFGFRQPVLGRALFPLNGPKNLPEDRRLAAALSDFYELRNPEATEPIETFLRAHPRSRWRPAILVNLGRIYHHTARFSKAFEALQQAWTLTKGATDQNSMRLANEAAALLAEMYVFLGRQPELASLLEDLRGHSLMGEFAASIASCGIANWQMINEPQVTFKCGPLALASVRRALDFAAPYHKAILDEPSTFNGTSLDQMWRLADKMQMNYQIAFRQPGAVILLPAMVHWKLGHYSAIARESDGRFHIKDSMFQQQVWATPAALDEEASGYFLVPKRPLPAGWRTVSEAEAKRVWGRAGPSTPDKFATNPWELTADCAKGSGRGQAQYDMHLLVAGLQIFDVPIGYVPPRGPQMDFRVTYNQREATETGEWSNFGENWRFNWIAFINDTPNSPQSAVYLNTAGGGRITFDHQTANVWKTQKQSHTRLTMTSSNSYELFYPDGSKEIYDQPDLTNGVNRRVFLTRVMDPASNTVSLVYGENLRLGQIIDAINGTNIITHESSDTNNPLYYRISKITDPFMREATFQYDSNSRLTNITDVINLKSRFTYSTNFITSMTTEYGTTKFHTHNHEAEHEIIRWIEIEDPYGEKERVEWRDPAPGVAETVHTNQVPEGMNVENDELNRRTTFYWDKKAMREHPLDYTKARLTRFFKLSGFDSPGALQSRDEPLENRIWFTYSGQSDPETAGDHYKPIKIGRRLDDGSTQTNTFQYDSFHNLTNYIDPVGRSTLLVYSNNGIDLLSVRQYTASGSDLLATFTYNPQHLPLTYVDAAGETTRFRYNANGQLTHVTNALNQVTTLAYDANSRLTSVTVSNNTTSFTYDGSNRVYTVQDSEGYTITNHYDALDRITKIEYPGTNTYEQFVYNKLDLAQYRDRNGRWSRNFYNANRQLIAAEDPLGRLTKFGWCGCGSLDSITDPMGRVTSWIRDTQGRVTSKIYPDLTSVNYTYEDTTSRLRSITDAKNQSKWFTYFSDNNLNQISYTNAPGTTNVSFTYGAFYNRLITITDGIGGTTNLYYTATNGTLGAGMLKSIDGPFSNDTITFEYDELGRVKERDINGSAERYTYDALSRLTRMTNVLGGFTNNYVNQTFRPTSIKYPNGQNTYFTYYDNTGDQRLESIWHKRSGDTDTVSKFQYTYDPGDQIKTWAQTIDAGDSNTWVMEYDLADQLRAVTIRTNGMTGAIVKRYAYASDTARNRTGEQIDDMPNQAMHNTLNQLTNMQSAGPTRFTGWLNETGLVKIVRDAVTNTATMTSATNFVGSANLALGSNVLSIIAWDSQNNLATNRYEVVITNDLPTTLQYDANGNLTNQYTSTYTNSYDWDGEDRLVRITRRSTADPIEYKHEFVYDGFGRRAQIVERTNGVVITAKRYLWCGTVICERRNSVGTTIEHQYFPEGEWHDPGKYLYTRDHLGSIRNVNGGSASAVLQARYDYDPYGRKTTLVESNEMAFGYTGHFYHGQSGLHLAMFRALDSGMGRWLSRDPIEESGGLNLYAYADGDPINGLDPLGLANVDVKLPGKWRANVQGVPGTDAYEIHVYNAQNREVGVLNRHGWIRKHGHTQVPVLPRDVANALNGINVSQARARNLLSAKGTGNIKFMMERLSRFGGAAGLTLLLFDSEAKAAAIKAGAHDYLKEKCKKNNDAWALVSELALRHELNQTALFSGDVWMGGNRALEAGGAQ